jgi:hypothetical protein
MDMTVPPANAMEIKVNAKQWGWEFVYPNGGSGNELHVPVHKPVKLIISSSDVLHSFFVPALRVKRDVVPGMYTTQWFEATHVGQDDIMCAEYCGGRSKDSSGNELPFIQQTGHWSMHSMLHVETEEDFTKYLIGIGDPCASYTVKGQTCPDSVSSPRDGRSTRRRPARGATPPPATSSWARRGRASGARRSRPTTAR